MENEELLEALRHIIKEETRAAVKEEVRIAVKEEIQPIKEDINGINTRLDKMDARLDNMDNRLDKVDADIVELKARATQREVNLENNINKNIELLLEGHSNLVHRMNEIQKDTSRIERIEAELFATKEITKDNVQSIKKLQSKRKI